MPKKIYKKDTDKKLKEIGVLPSSDEWDRKSNVGHTHAISDIKNLQSKLDTIPSIKTLNTNNSSIFPVSSSETISGSGSINLHKVSKTGKFSDLSNRGEAFLSWGGQNLVGAYGPIDSAMIPDLGANRLAFMPPAGISVEYSRDSGTTWQDYGATDSQKLALTSTGANFIIGKADSSNKATERYMLRISLRTSEGKVYTQLNKFALYVSTNGSNGSYCTIRARTQDNYLNKVDKWVVFANKQSISGWSGWNIINTSTITTFGNTASSQYGEIQFIFGCTSGSTSHVGLQILRLMGFGGVGWTTPSNRAKIGHIYAYDTSQNVTFPEGVSAKSFTENGTSLANKYLGKKAKAADADKLDGNDSTYYLNYNNLTNRPTLGTAASKNTGIASGNIPVLDSNGKLADSVIPAVAITDTYVVATKAAMLALNAQKGDIAIRSDLNKSFVLQATPASTPENWIELLTPTDAVLSVNGKKGAVTLSLDDIKDGSDRKLADYLPLSGGNVTGTLSATLLSADIIGTGTGDNNFFQSRKFRGEGDAATYYHAVDFGFAGHNQVDFYEYGGIWNFWINQNPAPTTDPNNLCLQIGQTYLKNKSYQYDWPNASGTLALKSDIPTKVSELTNDSKFVTSSGVTSVATSGTGLSGGTITSTGTITLDSSSAGNAAANKVILRNAAGSIQTEKLAVSSGTTTKATMQYNSTEDCIEFIFA